ncbi:MAG: hypothetical protein ACRD1Q_08330 [Vicinamibacterales bacterium]
MRSPANAALVVVLILCALVAFVVPFWYWDGGLIEIEGTQFVRQYLDGRSGLLRIVFDPHANDLGTFQARELSFLFDYLDARAFGARMALDWPSFVPLSALLSGLLTIVICLLSLRGLPRLLQLTVSCAFLVYLTNYVNVVTMGMHYRSTKVLLAPVLLGTTMYVARSCGGRSSRWAPPIVFVLFSIMSLLDRQGFFYALLGLAVLVVFAATTTGGWRVAAAGAGAVAFMVFYNAALGPMLVERINGYVPNAEYQQLPLGNLLTDPAIVAHASALLVQAGAALFGGLPVSLFGILVVLPVAGAVIRRRRLSRTILILAGMLLVGEIALASLMIVRHPPVYDYYDHRIWYYPLPFQAMILGILVVVMSRLSAGWSRSQTAVALALLAAIVVSNVVHWGDYRRAQLRSRWFPVVYTQTTALKESLADGRPRPSLSPEYIALYDVCLRLSPALRERAAGIHRAGP